MTRMGVTRLLVAAGLSTALAGTPAWALAGTATGRTELTVECRGGEQARPSDASVPTETTGPAVGADAVGATAIPGPTSPAGTSSSAGTAARAGSTSPSRPSATSGATSTTSTSATAGAKGNSSTQNTAHPATPAHATGTTETSGTQGAAPEQGPSAPSVAGTGNAAGDSTTAGQEFEAQAGPAQARRATTGRIPATADATAAIWDAVLLFALAALLAGVTGRRCPTGSEVEDPSTDK